MKLTASICLLVVLALANQAQADRLKCKYKKLTIITISLSSAAQNI